MRWFRTPRRRLHIRMLNGYDYTATESERVNLETLMANIVSSLATFSGEGAFVGQEGVVWIRANQVEAIWIATRYPD